MPTSNEQTDTRRAGGHVPALYRTLTERSPLPIAITAGAAHVLRWANPAFCRAVERERAALVGRPVGAAVPAAVAVGALELLDWVYRTGEGASLADQPYVDAAPTHLPWLAAVWPVPDDRGRAVGLVLQGGPPPRDEQGVAEVRAITERVLIAGLREQERAEAALRESEERYRRLVESSPEAVAVIREGDIIYVNPAGTRLLGAATAGELLGRPILDFIHPDHHDEVAARRRQLAELGQPTPLARQKGIRLDGRPIAIETAAVPITYAGRPAIQAVFRDITARTEAEEALRRSEARFRSLIQNSSDVIVVADHEGTIRYVSPSVERMLGYDPEGLVGASGFAFVCPDDRARARDFLGAVVAAPQESLSIELGLQHRDGSRREGEVLANNLLDDPSVGGLVVTVRDVTERKRVAATLLATRRQLAESRAAERLRLARELHDGAVQSLLGINYQLGARRRGPGAGQPRAAQPAALEAIREEVLGVVGQLRALIGDLRPPGLEEFGLSAALEGYVAQLRREGSPALPAITLDLDPGPLGLPTAAALDLFRNAQEALRNALRHSQARQVTVSLHRGEGIVVLEVRDDGRGFDVPPRLSDFARSSHFGLIGMAERVELAGGQLAIHSQPGQGTAVTAWLPVPGEGGGDE